MIVVGAGIAGLVCAIELERAGRSVLVLERESQVGGRVRSDRIDGFTIDRGFQVLFTAYPVISGYLDQRALQLRPFQPAARIALPGGTSVVGDALRDPSLLWPTLRSARIGVGDAWRLLKLRQLAVRLSDEACFAPEFSNLSTADFLRSRGFSSEVINDFFGPFYGGILLDRRLESSAGVLLFTFKMLAEGKAAVPAAGMGAIAQQLASHLRSTRIETGSTVASLVVERERVVGVTLVDGRMERAEDVVLATEAPVSARLAAAVRVRLDLPSHGRPSATLYLASSVNLLPGRALTLNAMPQATISHAVTMTGVAPEYGPGGSHLIAMTAVGAAAELGDDLLVPRALAELAMMRGASLPADPRIVAVVRVPYSQFAHPPGYFAHRPATATSLPGLWLGGEALHTSSLDGAARAGRAAARAIVARAHVESTSDRH